MRLDVPRCLPRERHPCRVQSERYNSSVVQTGLDGLVGKDFAPLKGLRIGIVCNQASIDLNIDHILALLLPLHERGFLTIQAVFGPQHGIGGHTQDNMIEWEGARSPQGWRVHSLYGEHRRPTAEMLEGVDLVVIDLQDAGARYYTFVWTMALCIKSCEELGVPVLVLDRPNPIGGLKVEGTVLRPGFASFVGLYPLPTRHGMTLAEIANYLRDAFFIRCELRIEPMRGWERSMHFKDTGLTWAMPSPNMPTADTALVYPGGCLVEGTNLSEGRGTTRPFEIVGAPFLDGHALCEPLNGLRLPGVKFRPVQFEPTFNKHTGQLCEGCFIHVLDRVAFEPVSATVAILQEVMRQARPEFRWKEPPYEYELEKRPIDILAGNDWLGRAIEELAPLEEIRERFSIECGEFERTRLEALIYS